MSEGKKPEVTDEVEEEEEEEEDLDDLDDVLEQLDRPRPSRTAAPATSTSTTAQPPTQPSLDDFDLSDADFETELAKGMQSLLAGLSGPSSSTTAGGQPSTAGPSATDDQAKKLQDLFGKMMAGDQVDEDELDSLLGGINGDAILKELGGAAGLSGGGGDDAEDSSAATPSVPPPPPPTLTSPSAVDASPKAGSSSSTPTQAGPSRQNATLTFDETIDRTLKNLKQSAEKAKASASSSTNPSTSDPFSALLSQLSSLDPSSLDPSLLEALNASGGLDDGDGSNDADIGKMLDGMMRQLMSREVLEEPLSELAEKYPPYIESHPDLPAADKTKYTTQLGLIQEILAIFKEPGFTDDPADGDVVGKARKDKVASLMGQMQDLGSPPDEVMGEMPEGFDINELGQNPENCSIM